MKIKLKKQKLKNLSSNKNAIPADLTPNIGAGGRDADKSGNGLCQTDWFCQSVNFCQTADYAC